jgi:hypothetical protein
MALPKLVNRISIGTTVNQQKAHRSNMSIEKGHMSNEIRARRVIDRN